MRPPYPIPRRALSGLCLALALAACETPEARDRAAEWREILASEAPVGAPGNAAETALKKRGITPGRGTYVTVADDGTRTSPCPDPAAAVTGREVAGRIGFNSNLVEVIACLDRDGRIVSHSVGIWIQ